MGLNPLPHERLRRALRGGPARIVLLRRVAAAVLLLLAAALALRPRPGRDADGVTTLIAARDLAPGSVLGREDVKVVELPPKFLPAGALADPSVTVGKVLIGGARRGETLTDVRVVGTQYAQLATGDTAAALVPVRLSDPGVADLLRPGGRVDVVTLGPDRDGASVLATDAVVVAVRQTEAKPGAAGGRLVVVALPRDAATRVAAASLGEPVAITLR